MTAETIARVNNRIESLQSASITKLRDQWKRTFKSNPPNWPPDLLKRYIANRWQEGVIGGFTPETLELIDRLLSERRSLRRTAVQGGARFVRHWRGEDHYVSAMQAGFTYRGRTFRSLSAVAKSITGQHISGPAFFGVPRAD